MRYFIKTFKFLLLSLIFSFNFNGIASAQINESAADTVKIPDTVSTIWQAIDDKTTELNNIIKAEKFDEVHLVAYAIRDLTTGLLKHPEAIPANKFELVKIQVKYVTTLADRLDENGDAKYKIATEDNFQKLQKIIAKIRTYYSSPTEMTTSKQ